MKHQDELFVSLEAWTRLPWLWHGFSTRGGGVSTVYQNPEPAEKRQDQPSLRDGDLNLGWTRDDDAGNVTENRRLLVEAVTGGRVPLVTVRQVHSNLSLVVSSVRATSTYVDDEGRAIQEADGLMSDAPGLLLGVQTADCVPVLVADTRRRVVAAFHAGWRGTAARIVERGVEQMRQEYGSLSDDLIAAIGPSIGACCYSVGDPVREDFAGKFSYGEALFTSRTGGSPAAASSKTLYLDLWEANRRQLLASGIAAEQIQTIGECTGCAGLPGRRRYFSHRREDGFTGRMLSVIGLAKHPSG